MFELPKLPYPENALEPHIDERTMKIHHDKHHAGYVAKLNDALEGQNDLLSMEIDELMRNISKVPKETKTQVVNNGGGHANHSLFWKIMSPRGGKPEGELKEALESSFGSFSNFQEEFTNAALSRFGSGWAWLVVKKGKLGVMDTKNQDSPLTEGHTPILGVDVWEHAYYLKYQNRRADYIKAWWNVVNWKEVARGFKVA